MPKRFSKGTVKLLIITLLKRNFDNSYTKNWNSCKKQRNFCLKLLCQTKEKYFNNVNVKKVSGNKTF